MESSGNQETEVEQSVAKEPRWRLLPSFCYLNKYVMNNHSSND